jgi:Bacterial TSP3 repeat
LADISTSPPPLLFELNPVSDTASSPHHSFLDLYLHQSHPTVLTPATATLSDLVWQPSGTSGIAGTSGTWVQSVPPPALARPALVPLFPRRPIIINTRPTRQNLTPVLRPVVTIQGVEIAFFQFPPADPTKPDAEPAYLAYRQAVLLPTDPAADLPLAEWSWYGKPLPAFRSGSRSELPNSVLPRPASQTFVDPPIATQVDWQRLSARVYRVPNSPSETRIDLWLDSELIATGLRGTASSDRFRAAFTLPRQGVVGLDNIHIFKGDTNPFLSADPASPASIGVDSDADGLSDLREEQYGTRSNLADTDGDGVSDGQEADQGTNPTNPRDWRIVGDTDVMQDVKVAFIQPGNSTVADYYLASVYEILRSDTGLTRRLRVSLRSNLATPALTFRCRAAAQYRVAVQRMSSGGNPTLALEGELHVSAIRQNRFKSGSGNTGFMSLGDAVSLKNLADPTHDARIDPLAPLLQVPISDIFNMREIRQVRIPTRAPRGTFVSNMQLGQALEHIAPANLPYQFVGIPGIPVFDYSSSGVASGGNLVLYRNNGVTTVKITRNRSDTDLIFTGSASLVGSGGPYGSGARIPFIDGRHTESFYVNKPVQTSFVGGFALSGTDNVQHEADADVSFADDPDDTDDPQYHNDPKDKSEDGGDSKQKPKTDDSAFACSATANRSDPAPATAAPAASSSENSASPGYSETEIQLPVQRATGAGVEMSPPSMVTLDLRFPDYERQDTRNPLNYGDDDGGKGLIIQHTESSIRWNIHGRGPIVMTTDATSDGEMQEVQIPAMRISTPTYESLYFL